MVGRWIPRAAAALVAGSLSAGCLLGDHFFRATGRVLDCVVLNPVADARIAVNVDRGSAPGPVSTVYTTGAAGQFDVYLSVDTGSWVTLTFQKTGYMPLSTQVKGLPSAPLELCMTPETGP
jgi:hypothetical protein